MEIERNGYSVAEAASLSTMRTRLETINDSFLIARTKDSDDVIGFVVGAATNERYLEDKSYEEVVPNKHDAQYLSILSLAVHPAVQGCGIGTQLLTAFAQLGIQTERKAIILTCLEDKIPFYQKNGYQDEGVSTSERAAEKWHKMLLPLVKK
ncbi:GNAT family N-acetyltransferase [Liquorilactobacillus capillatus]|nr:GNAT family N-acetyltransferase [Liquorilactobacillus capillatus]